MRRKYRPRPKSSGSRSYVRTLEEMEKPRCGCCWKAVEVDGSGVTWHCSCRKQAKCELCGRCAIHCVEHAVKPDPRKGDPFYVPWTNGKKREGGPPPVPRGAGSCVRKDPNNGRAHRPHRGKCPKWAFTAEVLEVA